MAEQRSYQQNAAVVSESPAAAVEQVRFHTVTAISSSDTYTHDCTVWDGTRELKAYAYVWDGKNTIPASIDMSMFGRMHHQQ